MPPSTKQPKLSALARLQRDINTGRTPEEPYITPENIVDADTRTLEEKARLLKWADAYEPIPWDQEIVTYRPKSKQEQKLGRIESFNTEPLDPLVTNEPLAEPLALTKHPPRLSTPIAQPTIHANTPGISSSLGRFRLESESSLSPKKQGLISKASKLASNELTFEFLGDNKQLKAVSRASIPLPPAMTYQRASELEQLVHD